MTGEELKEILKKDEVAFADLAEKLGISRQLLHSKLKASDIGIGFIQDIANAVNKSLYELIEGGKANDDNAEVTYLAKRRAQKSTAVLQNTVHNRFIETSRIPIYDVPIDASFLERYADDRDNFEPTGFLDIPRLRNCNFVARVSGNSMWPILRSGGYVACRIIEDFTYFDEGEMYFVSSKNGFETVKYVQTGDNPDELKLIPHNEKIRPAVLKKSYVLSMCLVEAWINFR